MKIISDLLAVLSKPSLTLLGENHRISKVSDIFCSNAPLLYWLRTHECNIYTEWLPTLTDNMPYNYETIAAIKDLIDINFYKRIIQELPNVRVFGLQTPTFNPFLHMDFQKAINYIRQYQLVNEARISEILPLHASIGEDIKMLIMFELSKQHLRQNTTMANVVNESLVKYPGKHITITGKAHVDELFQDSTQPPIIGMKTLIKAPSDSVVFDVASQPSPQVEKNTKFKTEDGFLKADYRFIFTNESTGRDFLDKVIPAYHATAACSIL